MRKIVASQQTHEIRGNPRCPLCTQNADVGPRLDAPDVIDGWRDRRSNVRINLDAVAEARRLNKLSALSAWFRRYSSDQEVPLVKRLDIGTITHDTPEYSVLEKLDLTLSTIAYKTQEPGQNSQFNPQNDHPLIFAASQQEANYYIRQLGELGYVVAALGSAAIRRADTNA